MSFRRGRCVCMVMQQWRSGIRRVHLSADSACLRVSREKCCRAASCQISGRRKLLQCESTQMRVPRARSQLNRTYSFLHHKDSACLRVSPSAPVSSFWLQSTPSSAQILQAVAPSLVELLDGPWPALSIAARLPDSASIHSWFEQAIVSVIRRLNRIVVELS